MSLLALLLSELTCFFFNYLLNKYILFRLLVQSGQGMCFKVESDLIDLLYYIFDLRSELVENALKRQLLRHGPFHFDFLTEEVDGELESSRKVLKNRCKVSVFFILIVE